MRPPITRWASDNVFVRMAVATIALLTALAVLPVVTSSIPSAEAQTPEPIITVDAHTEGVWGDHWPSTVGVTVTIGTDSWNTTTDENGNFWFDLRPFDVQAGQSVSATDETTTKVHTVFALAVTGVDDTENVVTGTADAGTNVWVDVHGVADVGRTVVADGSGVWATDFDDPGDGGATFDLVPGSNGYTGQYDADSDATNADWRVLNAMVTVDAHTDGAWGGDFAAGATITLSRGGDSCTTTSDEWGNFGFDLRNCPTPIDLVVGNVVSVTDGATTKDVTIVPLAITAVDAALDTVTGTADAGVEIQVWSHEGGDAVTVTGPSWIADFTGIIDLVPGTNGSAQHYDAEGDATNADWRVTNPTFSVETPHNIWSTGDGWIEGTTVTLTIDDPSNGVGTDYTDTTSMETWGPEPHETGFNFNTDPFVIEPTHIVTATDGTNIKELTVVSVTVDTIDEINATLAGMAPANAFVEVNAGDDVSNAHRSVQADGSGVWAADFSVPGPQDHENETMSFSPGVGGAAETYDDDGDGNHRSWRILSPRFKAGVDNDDLSGWEWLPNATVDISIDGGTPYSYQTDEWGNFGGGVALDLNVGQYLVATDGISTKDFVIRNLYVTSVDVDNDLVHGTSTPGDVVQVETHGEDGQWREVTADGVTGDWTADFSVVWEDQAVFDIVSGSSGNARYYEPDGDETQRSWHVSDPRITASVNHEEVWTYDFPDEPDGQMLYYRLDDPATAEIDFEGTMPLLVQDGSTQSGDHSFGRFDVQAGHTFTVRNRPFDVPLDGGMERVLAISHVTVDSVDPDLDVITGTADPAEGPRVCVWSNDAELCDDNPGFTWNPDNTWAADFGSIGSDVAPGHWNSASQFETDGDETHYWWNLPPWIVVELAEEDDGGVPLWPDAVRVEQWTGPIVYLEIDGNPIAQWTYEESWDYTFELPGFDIEPGHIVRVHDSADDKTVLVEPLTIDQVNFSGDVPPNTVEGTTSPYRDVRVEASASVGGWWAERWVNSDSSGNFTADFGVPGNGWREQWTAELGGAEGLGRNMRLELYDSDNDRVTTRQCEGLERIEIARSDGRVDAFDFPEGSTVTLEIDDPATGQGVDYTDTAIAVRNPENPCETIATFDLGGYEIPDEATVSAGDGETTVTTIVIAFTIDNVNPDADTVSGQAAIGADVYVEADGNWRYVVAEDDPSDGVDVGYWVADFSVQGSEPGEEQIVDLGPGSSGRAIMLDDVGNTTELSWRISAAQFAVSPAEDNIDGWEWLPNDQVTITVNSVAVPGSPFGTDEGGNFGMGWDPAELNIVAGDLIVVSDGDSTKEHTVTELVVTGVDEAADVVSGMAEPGSTVDVWVHEPEANLQVTADGSGVWDADFSAQVDLVAGSNGNSGQCDDDNDCTNAGWWIRNAQFGVSPAEDHIDASDWAPNSSVTITVNGTVMPGSPFESDEWGNFGVWDLGELDIVAGDLVVVSDGDSIKDHTVTDLVVMDVDELSDVVSGTALAGSKVDVWVHDTYANLTVTACDDSVEFPCDGDDAVGTWHADFSSQVDLVASSNGNSGQCDDDSDCTYAPWQIVNPTFTVSSQSDWIGDGQQWMPDTLITVTVDDDDDETNGVLFETSTMSGGEGYFHVELWEYPFDLQPGHYVVVTDDDATKAHRVTDLVIAGVDELSDVVSGLAEPGSTVDVWVHESEANLSVTACNNSGFPCNGDAVGTWHADFSSLADLVPGSNGNSGQWDNDGDATFAGWQISNAVFTVNAENDWLGGWDGWLPDAPITVTFDDDEDPGNGVLHTAETISHGEDGFDLDLSEEFDIQPGQYVVATDTETTKTHWVTGVAVTDIDIDADTIVGIADPGAEVEVSIWTDQDFAVARLVVACDGSEFYPCMGDDPLGTWFADFSVAVTNPDNNDDENQAWDIEAGSQGAVNEYDEDRDSTQIDWRLPNAQLAAIPADDSVHGEEWVPNSLVTVTVNGVEVPGSPIGTDDGGNFDPGWDPEELDLAAGDLVVASDGISTKEHTVTVLVVTGVDEVSDIVSGMAEPGSAVGVWVHETEANLEVTACNNSGFPCNGDAVGTWHADFSSQVDLVPGSEGNSGQWDEDGDATWAFWRVRGLPSFGVWAEIDFIQGFEFSGDTVTVTFDSNENPDDGVLFTESMELDPEGNFWRPLEGEFDIEVGQYVTVTDGTTTKTTWVAPVDVTDVDLVNDTVAGVADPDAEIFLDDNRDLHWTVTSDGSGDWFADLDGEVDIYAPWIVVASQTDEDGDATFAVWETAATVEGHVFLEGAPLAGVEVWLGPNSYTCTNADGYFLFDEASIIHGSAVATGPAVDAVADCANAEFVDGDGIPLLVARYGDFDFSDGYEYIEFNVERAGAIQTVVTEEFDGVDWIPLDGVMVHAFDLNDPDFVDAYGSDPDPAEYRAIFDGDLGQIDMIWTGGYLFRPAGTTELRYQGVTNVLILAEFADGTIFGDQTSAAEFEDRGDGVSVGPTIVFPNRPPVITEISGPVDPVTAGNVVTVVATFTDPNVSDAHTATLDWGDGTMTDATVVFDAGEGTATGDHAYAELGVYTVTVTVTDSGELFDSEEFQYVVVYDPLGGFVTGGGTFDSPPGAYVADPDAEGSANFGFVSKYKKNAIVPTGNTQFTFQTGDINFHSGEYQWLVVSGESARFKGIGTINGSDGFGVMVTAVDEKLTDDTDTDLFRIRIWDEATGDVVYDNQMGEAADAVVGTELTGGSIVVPKAKKVK